MAILVNKCRGCVPTTIQISFYTPATSQTCQHTAVFLPSIHHSITRMIKVIY